MESSEGLSCNLGNCTRRLFRFGYMQAAASPAAREGAGLLHRGTAKAQEAWYAAKAGSSGVASHMQHWLAAVWSWLQGLWGQLQQWWAAAWMRLQGLWPQLQQWQAAAQMRLQGLWGHSQQWLAAAWMWLQGLWGHLQQFLAAAWTWLQGLWARLMHIGQDTGNRIRGALPRQLKPSAN